MRIAFAPYNFTLVGTDQAGVVNGEIHSIRVSLRAGVWAVRHKERVECFQDFPDANLGQEFSCKLATKILQDDGWYPGKIDQSETLDEVSSRAGGLVSIAKDSVGLNGPFVLPFGEGLEKNGILLRVDGNSTEWKRPQYPQHATSLTIMAGMLVKNMAAGDWEKAGEVLEQAWRLIREEAPPEIIRVYADARMHGASGCVWCGDNTLFCMAPSEWHGAISSIVGVEKLPFQISYQGAGLRAALKP